MENYLSGEFPKKREIELTFGFFPVDQQVSSFAVNLSVPGATGFRDFSECGRAARLDLGALNELLLVSTQTVSSYPANSSSPSYQPHPKTPTKHLQTSPSLGRISPSLR